MYQATYSPEDNKLRLYAASRLDNETYQRVKKAGFRWAPKQELFVAPSWTPGREDLLLELAGEIGDEDYSPEERSADRAERFTGYRDKRMAEATGYADAFEAGPSVFGHQNRARAERQAARHDRYRVKGVSQWSKAEYWQTRTAGVIHHALYKSSAPVRRSRLLRLEAEQRKHQKKLDQALELFAAWEQVPHLDGANEPLPYIDRPGYLGPDKATKLAGLMAYKLTNTYYHDREYVHPRSGRKAGLHALLTDPQEPITPAEAAALWLSNRQRPDDPQSWFTRWANHYALRIGYEKAMLEAEGGMAADADMEPGGWLGQHQIERVYKSPASGRVVSVSFRHEGKLIRWNIERLGGAAYRPPTDQERAKFATATKERKVAEKAARPKVPPLVNPTDADAERLQAIWNAAGESKHKGHTAFVPSTVLRLTQAQYSANSKGSYARLEATEVSERLEKYERHRSRGGRVAVFKIRTADAPGSQWHAARRVVILTDKPQKPIPWDAVEEAAKEQPTEADVFPKLGELATVLSDWRKIGEKENHPLINDAAYLGWVYVSSSTQAHFTNAGRDAYARFRKENHAPVAT